ncbi:hypothetical protein [Bradyrhizobium sp. WSM3983]|uniref:hypothetical protein n=1 Tax=Bradyrhizobium sp. WSM3983 TaxID=1038867 RepID=UPI0003FFDE13|nr:hypothetical protein [Bradyrhizobium sp. WSM3983]
MVVDAEHGSLVTRAPLEQALSRCVLSLTMRLEEDAMGRGLLLWLLGVPIPVIILLWLFFGH